MSKVTLSEKLGKIKEACAKWEKELESYKKWALENDGVISMSEKVEITRRLSDIIAIKARIKQIEQKKEIKQVNSTLNEVDLRKKMNIGLTNLKSEIESIITMFGLE